ncbi:MAG: ankyrin repeat domain-containing protein [Coriobacteriales bacterium]
MQKLFTVIRQGKLDEVERILSKHPEAVNEVSGPKPKKDHGQSPLQVALKTGRLEIADYLMDHGADVNFMEAPDEDPGMRAPVLFDAISCAIESLCYKDFDTSEKAIPRIERMLQEGADANKKASNGMSPIGWTVWRAKYIIGSPTVYADSQEMVRKQAARILDLLLEYGADFKAWADEKEGRSSTNRSFYLNDYKPKDENDTDKLKDLRVFLQDYVRSRNLQI